MIGGQKVGCAVRERVVQQRARATSRRAWGDKKRYPCNGPALIIVFGIASRIHVAGPRARLGQGLSVYR